MSKIEPFFHDPAFGDSDHGLVTPDGDKAPQGWYFEKYDDEDDQGRYFAAMAGPFPSLDRARTEMKAYQH